jgi:Na+/H+ antiporter NhaD/arsenite permease-like protein
MLLGLGVLWVVSELIHPELDEAVKKNYTAAGALSRIDVPSVLFFLGILLAVGALESMQVLHHFATTLDTTIGNHSIIISLIGRSVSGLWRSSTELLSCKECWPSGFIRLRKANQRDDR